MHIKGLVRESMQRTDISSTANSDPMDLDWSLRVSSCWHYLQDGPTEKYGEPKMSLNKGSETWTYRSKNLKQQREKLQQGLREASMYLLQKCSHDIS